MGLLDWLERIQGLAAPHRRRALLLLAAAVASAFVLEAGGYRFRRSEDGVRLARALARDGVRVLAAEQSWRLGGHLYLPRTRIIDLQPSDVRGPRLTALACDPRVDAVVTWTQPSAETLVSVLECGFRLASAIDVRHRSYRRDRPSRAVAAVLANADIRALYAALPEEHRAHGPSTLDTMAGRSGSRHGRSAGSSADSGRAPSNARSGCR